MFHKAIYRFKLAVNRKAPPPTAGELFGQTLTKEVVYALGVVAAKRYYGTKRYESAYFHSQHKETQKNQKSSVLKFFWLAISPYQPCDWQSHWQTKEQNEHKSK